MTKADITVEGFISNELGIREAGSHRILDVTVPHNPQKLVDGKWVDDGDTVWFQASFWNDHGDAVLRAVEKGSLVALSGSVKLEVFKRTNGDAGGRVIVSNPTIAVVVRRPKKGQAVPVVETTTDVWNTPGNYNDETPF